MNPGAAQQSQAGTQEAAALVDRFGRMHRSLRISVTDVCNIRCVYCMPEDEPQFVESEKLLSFDAICRFVEFAAQYGITKVRITGGEPLIRRKLDRLIAQLSQVDAIEDLALTTNGMLLADQVAALHEAGLNRVNISLDTLSEDIFRRISRRSGLQRVLDGIEAARARPGLEVKLNALVLRDINLAGVLELVEFAMQRDLALRFIEFMPLDAERAWNAERVVRGEELRGLIEARFGPLLERRDGDPSRPAREYHLKSAPLATIGFIDTVSQPFCSTCDRMRLTADGKLRNCLFSSTEWDVASLLSHAIDAEGHARLLAQVQECLQAKYAAHGIAQPGFEQPERPMYRIGG